MKKKMIGLGLLLSGLAVSAVVPTKSDFTLSKMNKAPVIDGKISAGEWRDGTKIAGVLCHNSPFLSARQAVQYFAVDNQYFYYACRSELPPKGMELFNRAKKRDGAVFLDDNVEFLVCPPHEKFVYQIMANSKGFTYDKKFPVINGSTTHTDRQEWNPAVKCASSVQNGFWDFEMQIPLKEIGMTKPLRSGEIIRILAGRNWTRPMQQTSIQKAMYFSMPDEMAQFTYRPGAPRVNFNGLGNKIRSGAFDISFDIVNPGTKPAAVQYRLTVASDSAPRQEDSTITVPAGKTVPVKLVFSENNSVVRTVNAEFKSAGKVLYERSFMVNPANKPEWKDPRKQQISEMDFGVYPYYKKVKVRFGNPAQTANKLNGVTFILLRNNVKTACQAGTRGRFGFETEFSIDLKPGKYTLKAEITDASGKKSVKTQNFKVEKFAWEHNRIGMERIVIPPFKNLTYPALNQIKGTMTAYSFKDGFFDHISAGDSKDILAAPIQLFINRQTVRQKSFRFVEKSADRAVTESVLNWNGGTITVRGDFDYDGFCKFTMNVKPNGLQKINSAELRIPLKKEIATLIHSTCDLMRFNTAGYIPASNGLVWRSSQVRHTDKIRGNFRPYVWFGGVEKGIAWVSPSDKNWSLDPAKDALTLERTANAVTLHVNIVNKPTTWQKSFMLQHALQATPVKPQPSYRRKLTERVTFKNSWNLCTLAGSLCWSTDREYLFAPANHDYSFINLLKARKFDKAKDTKFINDFIKRNMPGYKAEAIRTVQNHMHRGIMYAKMAKYMVPYTNARVSWLSWREYQTYMDEWWCSEYRALNADEYNNTLTRSYQDMVLYELQRLVREGMEGIYFDNVRDWMNPNPVTGPAYRREDGTVQAYSDLFDLRELVKRTATMLYLEKKTFPDGRPVLTCHMTNTNLIPVLAFSTITLDLEAEYGSKDFQDRFREGYLRSTTLGTQTGCIPEILIQISGKKQQYVTRTFLAVTLAYDLPFVMNAGGLTQEWRKTWSMLYNAGYGTDDMKVYPCWTKGPAATAVKDWRLTSYTDKKSGKTIVAVCSFGNTASGKVTVPGMTRCIELESNKEIPIQNGAVQLSVPRHDFRLLQFSK